MFGFLGFADAARIGEAITVIAMRETAILAVRMASNLVTTVGADAMSRSEGASGNGLERSLVDDLASNDRSLHLDVLQSVYGNLEGVVRENDQIRELARFE